tara:strand:- start:2403 stop:3371 length:969 start_codon:yes stop_codon:yes gene_type:complete
MLKIRKFKLSDNKLWEDFITSSNNGTLFHYRKFLNYHPDDRFEDHSLLIFKKNKLISVFPASIINVNKQKKLISHPGLSVGSLVSLENLSFSDSIEIVKSLVSYSKLNGFSDIQITIPPIIYQKRISNYLEFAYFENGFKYLKREVSSILFLEENIEENLNKFKSSHKRALKSSINKGVEVKISENFEEFYNILEKNLSIRHNVSPTHTLNELKLIKKTFPNKVMLFSAYKEEAMISGVVNFIVNDHTILAFYISHDNDYQEYRPLNYLFYSVFDWCIKNNFKIYDFGIFTVNGIPNLGLGRFKENFGASGVFRDTIHLKLI